MVNLIVDLRVGKKEFKITLDTGSARDLIRANFAAQARRHPETRKACIERKAIEGGGIICETVIQGQETAAMTYVQVVDITLVSTLGMGGEPRVPVRVNFVEMDSRATFVAW